MNTWQTVIISVWVLLNAGAFFVIFVTDRQSHWWQLYLRFYVISMLLLVVGGILYRFWS